MIAVINRLTVPEEYADHLEKAFGGHSDLSEQPGFAGFEFLQKAEGGEYLVLTRWESQEDFETWRNSEAFREAHSNTTPNSPVKSELSQYEVVYQQ